MRESGEPSHPPRVALRRPVPEIIPDRLLSAGWLVALAAFLIGN